MNQQSSGSLQQIPLYFFFSEIMFYSLQRNTQDWLAASARREKRVLQPMKEKKNQLQLMKNQHVRTISQFPVHIRVHKQHSSLKKKKASFILMEELLKKRTKVKILPLQL